MIDKTNGHISIEDNLTLSQHLTISQFLASSGVSQWKKRWIDSVEVYTRGILDENSRKVTIVLVFNAERLQNIDLYYALPNEVDFVDLFGRGTGEISEFHEKVLFDEFGDNASPYPWYQFDWGAVRNQMSHIEVRYGVTLVHDPTLKVAYRFSLQWKGPFRRKRGSGSDFS